MVGCSPHSGPPLRLASRARFPGAAKLRSEQSEVDDVSPAQDPWMIAHRIEWLVVYEIAIARAEPKLAPYLAPSTRTLYARPFICLLQVKFAERPILDSNTNLYT